MMTQQTDTMPVLAGLVSITGVLVATETVEVPFDAEAGVYRHEGTVEFDVSRAAEQVVEQVVIRTADTKIETIGMGSWGERYDVTGLVSIAVDLSVSFEESEVVG